MQITIDIHQGVDRTAFWMLAATLGLAMAACAQVIVAFFQTLAARKQAEAAVTQSEAASAQVTASVHQVKMMMNQWVQSVGSADNATMPRCHIAKVRGGWGHSISVRIQLKNKGLGPANKVSVGRLDPNTDDIELGTEIEIDRSFLGIDEETAFEVPATLAINPGIIVRYESNHRTVIKHAVLYRKGELDIRNCPEHRIYGEDLDNEPNPDP